MKNIKDIKRIDTIKTISLNIAHLLNLFLIAWWLVAYKRSTFIDAIITLAILIAIFLLMPSENDKLSQDIINLEKELDWVNIRQSPECSDIFQVRYVNSYYVEYGHCQYSYKTGWINERGFTVDNFVAYWRKIPKID